MNLQEITDRLTALHKGIVDAFDEQPFISPSLDIRASGKCGVMLYRAFLSNGDYVIGRGNGDTPEAALADAERILSAIPPKGQRDLDEFCAALGKVIDLGKAKGIPVDFVNPLKATMERLSSNAITKASA